MSDDKVTEHPNLRLRSEVESLRQEVKTLLSLYTQTASANLVIAEELKELKKKISSLEKSKKAPPAI